MFLFRLTLFQYILEEYGIKCTVPRPWSNIENKLGLTKYLAFADHFDTLKAKNRISVPF